MIPTLSSSQPCTICHQSTRVRCGSCQRIYCLDHLTKTESGTQTIVGLCPDCLAIYAGNPSCYGPVRDVDAWTDEERASCMPDREPMSRP